MIITPSYVYVHIPKTGGIWVREAIKASGVPCYTGPMHTPAADILPAMGGRFSFTFVRNPVTWWRSFWAHASRSGWPSSMPAFHRIADCCLWYSYQEFMTRVLNDIPGEYTRIVNTYAEGVTRVGLFENLAADLSRITTEAGSPAPTGHPPENEGDYTDRSVSTPGIDAEIERTEAGVIEAYYQGALCPKYSSPQLPAPGTRQPASHLGQRSSCTATAAAGAPRARPSTARAAAAAVTPAPP